MTGMRAHYARSPGKEARGHVFARDEHRCVLCGATECLTIDHKMPLGAGGTNHFRNLQVLCEPCNQAKGNALPWPAAACLSGKG